MILPIKPLITKRSSFALSAITLAILPLYSAHADVFSYPQSPYSNSDFGGVGLMQMPTARMHDDGEFTLGTTLNKDYYHYWVSLQLLPWFETTIRYTQVPDTLYSSDTEFSGDTLYTDKGIDFKARLWKESYWLPEVAFGVRDFGGTGLFDGEYFVANKQFGPLDFTLGLGWGYLGQRGNISNPMCKLSDRFCADRDGFKGNGGSFDYERFFKGQSAIFGGVEYQTPFKPLQLKLEYDGNDYSEDFPVTRGKAMPQASPWNIGAVYQLTDWATANISYERGNTVTFGFSVNTNFNQLKASWLDNPTPALANKSSETYLTKKQWTALASDLDEIAGYSDPILFKDTKNKSLTLIANQTKYRDRDEAQMRAGILINNHVNDIETFNIIESVDNQPIVEASFDNYQFKKVANYEYIGSDISDSRKTLAPRKPTGIKVVDNSEDLNYGVAPTLKQSFGSAEGFYLFNVGLTASSDYWLTNNLTVGGSVYVNLYDNYDKFNFDTPTGDRTNNKRVRTLVRQYISDNPIRLDNLQLTWIDKLSDNLYGQAYGGYLETMYGGIGGEILYRPIESNWAIGADINYVKQRDPNSPFGFYKKENQGDYLVQTGTTVGNISVYYQPQWDWMPNTLLKVSAGRYLAEDNGITIDFSKQFDSGIIAGAFATKTDMSAEDYGEGSFTKGFYVSIPFDLMTVKPSTNRANISWLPLTRDGGQMLGRKYQLYDMTDSRSPWYTRKALSTN